MVKTAVSALLLVIVGATIGLILHCKGSSSKSAAQAMPAPVAQNAMPSAFVRPSSVALVMASREAQASLQTYNDRSQVEVPPAAAQEVASDRSWRLFVERKIAHHFSSPGGFRLTGQCQIEIIQQPNGALVGARIDTCGEEDSVRQAMLAAVYQAQPYPPGPAGAGMVSCCAQTAP